ncbi:MAG: hypothetical protein ACE5FN_00975 [Leptospirillia bacterium]
MSDISAVIESFKRCVSREDFFTRFYENLFEADPSLKSKFSNTNFDMQKTLLRKGVTTLIMRESGIQAANISLDRIAETHGEAGFNVTPYQYRTWVQSMLLTIRGGDPEFSPILEEAWRKVLTDGVEYMIKATQKV